MDKLRCVVCGGSKPDSQGLNCARCGKAMGLRSERCYVTSETKLKLLPRSQELSKFGVSVTSGASMEKRAGVQDAMNAIALVITVTEALRPGTLRDLVQYLRHKLLVPEEDILALRLDEPDEILTYCRMDTKDKNKM
jgi:hypothetical protein